MSCCFPSPPVRNWDRAKDKVSTQLFCNGGPYNSFLNKVVLHVQLGPRIQLTKRMKVADSPNRHYTSVSNSMPFIQVDTCTFIYVIYHSIYHGHVPCTIDNNYSSVTELHVYYSTRPPPSVPYAIARADN